VAGVAAMAASCAQLPHDGPSGKSFATAAQDSSGPYALVDLDYPVTQKIASRPPQVLRALAGSSAAGATDLIGEGDALTVTIYQAGSGPGGRNGEAGQKDETQTLPRLTVDRTGMIALPYGGAVRVAGLTPRQAGTAIEQALRGRIISPQVVVTLAANVANAVTVMGEVRNPGRFSLAPNNDTLIDLLATAGGGTKASADSTVTLVRGGKALKTSMTALMADPAENIRLAPGDQVRVAYEPRKFSTFGALTRSSQMAIDDERLTLASALSRMGGLDPKRADAASVLVFRMERPEVAQAIGVATLATGQSVPVVYRLNLSEPQGFFTANNFEIRDGDLIYAPRANAAELQSFFELVSSISRVGYDVGVASTLR